MTRYTFVLATLWQLPNMLHSFYYFPDFPSIFSYFDLVFVFGLGGSIMKLHHQFSL